MSFTIFNMHGVNIENIQYDENRFEGQVRVNWIECENRPMVNIFSYEDLASRKVAMKEALKFASDAMDFTDH